MACKGREHCLTQIRVVWFEFDMKMQHCVLFVLLPCFVTAQDGVEENDILSEIQSEIIELTKSTKESRREANVESYEKIFLRLTATGLQALGRNMLYASTQKVFQGDDDEEEETRRREQKNRAVNIIENWMDDEELEDTGRSQFVPQILGEPLFYTPASYWLQVITFAS